MQQSSNKSTTSIMAEHNTRQRKLCGALVWYLQRQHELAAQAERGDTVAADVRNNFVDANHMSISRVDAFIEAVGTYCAYRGLDMPWSVEV